MPAKTCDDGNDSNTDACTNLCELAECGDGFVHAGVEACDDGNGSNTDACTNLCELAECGDGFVQAGEQCDDGNTADGDLCNANCTRPKRVFVTSISWNGNLGGIAGAKSKCQARAATGNLGGTWDAWISTGTNNPAGRFVKSTTRYARLDGVEIAQTWADLTDGTLDAPINVNEFGDMSPQADVWTGTADDGTSLSEHCNGWTTSSGLGVLGIEGRNNAVDFNWTARSLINASNCSTLQRLYCFEQ
ncbi:Myxococcus cysteine-rich repeat-containing protein [Nannocystis exedens]|uniref:Myxococcus cysteine-rich repeat-containing protein n=1 Tax=Nannocystis exedens TaxID=54 RepID=A0A1I1TZA2_9BACT|nr:DUF1554 domain-containing protein [Nannocystis exedens]PCC71302.1 lipoprotein [Nannocystis exedens]SFD63966.1 Myxococcus cysteine-rich repeat-containing protein [Nannocystis exedens]